MLQAHIQIDKDLAVRAYKRALRPSAVKSFAISYGWLTFAAWLGVSAIDFFAGQVDLILYHSIFFFGLWVLEVAVATFYWQRILASTTQGWGFRATLDDDGVTTQYGETKHAWTDYSAYIEYEDYLQLIGPGGQISFLPKTAELAEIVVLTKEKIPNNSFKSPASRAGTGRLRRPVP